MRVHFFLIRGVYSSYHNHHHGLFIPFVPLFSLQSHEIHDLDTYTQYLVSIQVFNPEGLGPPTTVLVMTDEGGKIMTKQFFTPSPVLSLFSVMKRCRRYVGDLS